MILLLSMITGKRLSGLSFIFLLLIVTTIGASIGQAADGDDDDVVKRQTQIMVSYTRHEWWLVPWNDTQPVCAVYVDHENWPSGDDILIDCGSSIYNQWIKTPACEELANDASATTYCSGLYLHYVGNEPDEKTILVDLPAMQVWVTLSGCTPGSAPNFCVQLPKLMLTGEEPLPNERITTIHAMIYGQTITCEADTCEVPLRVTPLEGSKVEFWAESSFGDSSEHFTALVRVIDSGISATPGGAGYYVDVISSQWQGEQVASCAQIWQAFPPIGDLPRWLVTPELPELLASDEPYSYLAGRLIAQGLVDASLCPSEGLLSNGYADTCGLELSMPLVLEWQNRFDARIIEVARETGVPAQLMKNLFAQESQFWPGAFKVPNEFGLGQLTDNGAETILLWNPTFYEQFCPLVLDAGVCERGYIYLEEENRAILRGALALEVKADCPGCSDGIDLKNVDFSINLFAHTLLANCEQVAQIVYNATGGSIAGTVSSYDDLWRFTVANYHIGPGCLSYAMYNTWSAKHQLNWDQVSSRLTPACESVIPYVEKISNLP